MGGEGGVCKKGKKDGIIPPTLYKKGAEVVTDMIAQELPEYENPPVTEVVCGLFFKPIQSLLAPYLGLLWEKFKSDYPLCREVAPLVPTIEQFDDTPSVELALADTPPLPRIWFVHVKENGIIQVQRDSFLHNWRKVRPDDAYPRYHSIIEMFRDRLACFDIFLQENNLGKIIPQQYEMTYVNHIPLDEGWKERGDVGKVFPDVAWQQRADRFLAVPEDINWRTSFPLPNREGRLHATLRNAKRNSDGQPLLLFELTARGIGRDSSPEAMWRWFDMAREWIVHGFTDLTGHEIQQNEWGRRR